MTLILVAVARARWRPCFFFNDTATTEIYTLSLHDALPISCVSGLRAVPSSRPSRSTTSAAPQPERKTGFEPATLTMARSEEHTSELQSRQYLVCRLLLEKKKRTSW